MYKQKHKVPLHITAKHNKENKNYSVAFFYSFFLLFSLAIALLSSIFFLLRCYFFFLFFSSRLRDRCVVPSRLKVHLKRGEMHSLHCAIFRQPAIVTASSCFSFTVMRQAIGFFLIFILHLLLENHVSDETFEQRVTKVLSF